MRSTQQGVVLLMFAVGAAALFAMAGLALDLGYTYVNKSRVQNAVDAAALAGAKELQRLSPGATLSATQQTLIETEARDAFTRNLTRINGATPAIPDSDIVVTYYSALPPFTSSGPLRFVRVSLANSATGASWKNWFVRVLPGIGDELSVGASATAGPSPGLSQACANYFPVLLCPQDLVTYQDDDSDGVYDCLDSSGDSGMNGIIASSTPDNHPDICDTDIDSANGDNTLFGFQLGVDYELKRSPGSSGMGQGGNMGGGNNDPPADVGPGNFRLLALAAPGGMVLREQLAGELHTCFTSPGSLITTEPGFTGGPTWQGVNARFGLYQGGSVNNADHPADTCTDDMRYSQYVTETPPTPSCDRSGVDLNNTPNRQPGRRVVPVPIGNCLGPPNVDPNTGLELESLNGRSDLPLIGVACMFLTEPVGMGANGNIFAELVEGGCGGSGGFGPPTGMNGTPTPDFGPGLREIVLYKDPLTKDS